MSKPGFLAPETLALHAGQQPDPTTGARAVPIHNTTAYVFPDPDTAAARFNLELPGEIYSRINNPTVAVLEERLAALDGGVAAVCTSTGMSAIWLAICTLMSAGAHIVASRALYGGTANFFAQTLPRFGITTTFVDPREPDAFRAAMRAETRLLFGEVIGNPGLEVMDVAAVAQVAHEAGLPLMIDSTFTTPMLCRPIDLGADIVMHSVTKWLGGHGAAMGGVVIDGGRFDWGSSARFPTLTEPYAGYAGIRFAEEYGPAAFAMRARAEGLRDFGASMAGATAFQLLQGVETLPLRMARHVENARGVAAFLAEMRDKGAGVAWVRHPSLPDHPDHALAKRILPQGEGAVVTFGVEGGRAAGVKFIEALQLFSHVANVGDAKSLVIHPASTTHAQLDAEGLAAAGIGEEMIRLSIGLEGLGDIISDLKQALKASQR